MKIKTKYMDFPPKGGISQNRGKGIYGEWGERAKLGESWKTAGFHALAALKYN